MLENKNNQDQLLQRLENMHKQQQINELKKKGAINENDNDIGVGHYDITSVASSINQMLLDEQQSNAISQSFVDDSGVLRHPTDTDDDTQHQRSVKEAIVDLYLAIKIRSTEELDAINDGNLHDEKDKLLAQMDSF